MRKVPHIVGNWQTLVSIPVEQEILLDMFQSLENVDPIDQMHISLSKTVYFKEFQLQELDQQLKRAFKNFEPFTVGFSQVSLYWNDTRDRCFIAADIGPGHAELVRLTERVDQVLSAFNHPVFYSDPKFHVSFGSQTDIDPSVVTDLQKEFGFELKRTGFLVDSIQLKFGNKLLTYTTTD
ncbi:U6 snRNA phosphodiesterase Usb1 [Gorgonomyces haynaldii]|nr:U6 snRNA phosphodiesterase Usb1 [Gorgonomyces haynaldii]